MSSFSSLQACGFIGWLTLNINEICGIQSMPTWTNKIQFKLQKNRKLSFFALAHRHYGTLIMPCIIYHNFTSIYRPTSTVIIIFSEENKSLCLVRVVCYSCSCLLKRVRAFSRAQHVEWNMWDLMITWAHVFVFNQAAIHGTTKNLK